MTGQHPADRIGQRLPELLDELAAPRLPDYYDDLLRTTAATRQLPSWASFERWLPVSTIARPAPFGLPSWQPVLLLLALILTAAVGTLLVIGSQSRVPAPFGLADNGVLLASTLDGTLITIDPDTGETSPLSNGGDRWYPTYSRDGSTMAYFSKDQATDPTSGEPVMALMIANADGSNPRELLNPADAVAWLDFSPSGGELLAITEADEGQDVWLFDTATLTARSIDPGMAISWPVFRPNGEIVFKGATAFPNTTWGYYVSSTANPEPRPLIPPTGNDVKDFALSPDGSTLVYSKWDTPKGFAGHVFAIDVDTAHERPLDLAGYGDGIADMSPAFTPDGRSLIVNRVSPGAAVAQVIVRTDGSGTPVVLTPPPGTDPYVTPERLFSPDGSQVVVRYPGSNEVWIYDAGTGDGHRIEGVTAEGLSWQRR